MVGKYGPDLSAERKGPDAGSCEYGNEQLDSIRCGEFLSN